MKKTKASTIALGGICLALTVIFMYAGSFVPGIELTLFAISSLFVAVMIIESGAGAGILLYVAATLLGLIIVPNKLALIPYAFLFGYYGVLKYFIEKLRNGVFQIIVKAAFFTAVLCIGFLGFKTLLLGDDLPDYPIAVLVVAGIVVMMLYDYIYTLIINFYIKRIKGRGADNMKLS